MAKQCVGKVLGLFISIKDEDGVTRTIPQESINVDPQGVIKDKFYAKDPNRSILLSSIESYTLASDHTIQMPEGALGENILMDFNPYDLHLGQQLQIADVIFEITQECTLCKGLAKIDPKAPKLLKKHRGIFAKAVTDGMIQKEDPIYIK